MHNKTPFHLIFALVACLTLAACGKGSGATSEAAAEPTSDTTRGSAAEPEEASPLAALWTGTCRDQRFDPFEIVSILERYEFGETVTKITTLHASPDCVDAVIELRETGIYTAGEPSAEGVRSLDIRFESVFAKPLTANARNALNAWRACDAIDWLVGQERDISNRTGDPIATRCWIRTPREVFDIANVSGNTLVLGLQDDPIDKTSPENRPVILDVSHTFTRQ